MKYKVGDKVRVKSKEWFEEMKKESSLVIINGLSFLEEMAKFCGKEAIITYCCNEDGTYRLDIDNLYWFNDGMLEDSYNPEKSIISEGMIKDIAEVIKKHNLGVCVSENEGKLIIGPLKVEEEDDLPIDTPVMVCDILDDWRFRYYAGNKECFVYCNKSTYGDDCKNRWKYIIPFERFNPTNIEESLKYNIVK